MGLPRILVRGLPGNLLDPYLAGMTTVTLASITLKPPIKPAVFCQEKIYDKKISILLDKSRHIYYIVG